jgi:hypothetical protein
MDYISWCSFQPLMKDIQPSSTTCNLEGCRYIECFTMRPFTTDHSARWYNWTNHRQVQFGQTWTIANRRCLTDISKPSVFCQLLKCRICVKIFGSIFALRLRLQPRATSRFATTTSDNQYWGGTSEVRRRKRRLWRGNASLNFHCHKQCLTVQYWAKVIVIWGVPC